MEQQQLDTKELKLPLEMILANTSQDTINKMLQHNRFIQYTNYKMEPYKQREFERYC